MDEYEYDRIERQERKEDMRAKYSKDEDEEKVSTRKKQALEIQKVKEGVKTFGAVDPATMPQGPEGGVTGP